MTKKVALGFIIDGFLTCVACVKHLAQIIEYPNLFFMTLSKPKKVDADYICRECNREFGSEDSLNAADWVASEYVKHAVPKPHPYLRPHNM